MELGGVNLSARLCTFKRSEFCKSKIIRRTNVTYFKVFSSNSRYL